MVAGQCAPDCGTSLSPVSNLTHESCVSRHDRIGGEECDALALRLRDQDAVEWVLVQQW
jgi:hypothetical protein